MQRSIFIKAYQHPYRLIDRRRTFANHRLVVLAQPTALRRDCPCAQSRRQTW